MPTRRSRRPSAPGIRGSARGAIARLGNVEMYAAEITPGLLERGVEIEERLELPLEYVDSPRVRSARRLMRLGELERPRGDPRGARGHAPAARGDEGREQWPFGQLSRARVARRSLAAGARPRLTAHELAEQTQTSSPGLGWDGSRRWSRRTSASSSEARTSAEEALASARDNSNEFFAVFSLGVLGRLEPLGNLHAAGAHLRELPRAAPRGRAERPDEPVWADAIETLVALGELEQPRLPRALRGERRAAGSPRRGRR